MKNIPYVLSKRAKTLLVGLLMLAGDALFIWAIYHLVQLARHAL